MKPASNAFEIGYGPSFELIDHSEVWLGHVPGTPGFEMIFAKLERKLNTDQMLEIAQMRALWVRVQGMGQRI